VKIMHVFDVVASPQMGLISVGLIVSITLLATRLHKHRSRTVDEPQTPWATRRAVRVLMSDQDLSDALSRAINTEKQQGSRAAQRVRHYKSLIPDAGSPEPEPVAARVIGPPQRF
jgi:hypothetical protein